MSNSNKPLLKSVTTSPEQEQPAGSVTASSSSIAKESTVSSVLPSSKLEATKTGVVTGSVDLSKLLSSSSSTSKGPKVTTKNAENVSWTDNQDELLLLAVMDSKKVPTERDEGDNEEKEAEEGEDDWDFIDWDSIAVSVPDKTPVQCLKRYLKLKKTHDAKAPQENPSVTVDSSSSSSQPQKRKLTISTVQQSEEITVFPPKKKKEPTRWSEDELALLQTLTEQHTSREFSFQIYYYFLRF